MFNLQNSGKGYQKILLALRQNIAAFLMNIPSEKHIYEPKEDPSARVLYSFRLFQIKGNWAMLGILPTFPSWKRKCRLHGNTVRLRREGVKFCRRPSFQDPSVSQKSGEPGLLLQFCVQKQLCLTALQLTQPYVSEELNNFYNTETFFF